MSEDELTHIEKPFSEFDSTLTLFEMQNRYTDLRECWDKLLIDMQELKQWFRENNNE